MRASSLKFGLVLALSLGLAACGSDMDELDQYINEIKARPGGRIDPLPEITPYEGFTYVADKQGMRSPFVPDTPQATGPAAGGILADWGAEVVKIEPLGGDPCRSFRYMLGTDMPNNPIFEMDNRSKRSLALDLTTDEGKEIAEQLIADADVLVTNVRLGGLERLGLDAESVTARHPRLIYAAITGYGIRS